MKIITPHYILMRDRVSTNLSIAFDKTIENKKVSKEDIEFHKKSN